MGIVPHGKDVSAGGEKQGVGLAYSTVGDVVIFYDNRCRMP